MKLYWALMIAMCIVIPAHGAWKIADFTIITVGLSFIGKR